MERRVLVQEICFSVSSFHPVNKTRVHLICPLNESHFSLTLWGKWTNLNAIFAITLCRLPHWGIFLKLKASGLEKCCVMRPQTSKKVIKYLNYSLGSYWLSPWSAGARLILTWFFNQTKWGHTTEEEILSHGINIARVSKGIEILSFGVFYQPPSH